MTTIRDILGDLGDDFSEVKQRARGFIDVMVDAAEEADRFADTLAEGLESLVRQMDQSQQFGIKEAIAGLRRGSGELAEKMDSGVIPGFLQFNSVLVDTRRSLETVRNTIGVSVIPRIRDAVAVTASWTGAARGFIASGFVNYLRCVAVFSHQAAVALCHLLGVARLLEAVDLAGLKLKKVLVSEIRLLVQFDDPPEIDCPPPCGEGGDGGGGWLEVIRDLLALIIDMVPIVEQILGYIDTIKELLDLWGLLEEVVKNGLAWLLEAIDLAGLKLKKVLVSEIRLKVQFGDSPEIDCPPPCGEGADGGDDDDGGGWLETIREWWGIFDDIMSFIDDILGYIDTIKKLVGLWDSLKERMEDASWAALAPLAKKIAIAAAVAAVVAGIVFAVKDFIEFLDEGDSAFGDFLEHLGLADDVRELFDDFADLAEEFVEVLMLGAEIAVSTFAAAFQVVWAVVRPVIAGIGELIIAWYRDIVIPALSFVVGLWKSLFDTVGDDAGEFFDDVIALFELFGDIVAAIIDVVVTNVVTYFRILGTVAGAVLGVVAQIITWLFAEVILPWLSAVVERWTLVFEIISEAVERFADFWTGLMERIGEAAANPAAAFRSAWETTFEAISEWIDRLVDGFLSVGEAAMDLPFVGGALEMGGDLLDGARDAFAPGSDSAELSGANNINQTGNVSVEVDASNADDPDAVGRQTAGQTEEAIAQILRQSGAALAGGEM